MDTPRNDASEEDQLKDKKPSGDESRGPFETFDPEVRESRIPIVMFTDDACEQHVWYDGHVSQGQVQCPTGPPDVRNKDAVVMSPAYLGFAIEPYEMRYLHYMGVGILFARPRRGEFMQPSIDTILVCRGLAQLFGEEGCGFRKIIDVGTGSGFIGKFAGALAPGEGRLAVTLIDIDETAAQYCQTSRFGARPVGLGGREVEWKYETGDAAKLLQDQPDFDLIISNPPYIPAREEVNQENGIIKPTGFWEGCGLLVHMLENLFNGRHPPGAHLVLQVTSLTLKSQRVQALFKEAPSKGVKIRILLEREIAWKAWYAGRGGGPSYLLAKGDEVEKRQQLGDCSYFVGARPPGDSRQGGKRDRLHGYHWHVAYVLDITRDGSATVAATKDEEAVRVFSANADDAV